MDVNDCRKIAHVLLHVGITMQAINANVIAGTTVQEAQCRNLAGTTVQVMNNSKSEEQVV